ncbi:hypothetical protein G7085_06040 [Tessaracoccus sp. HDW20]|uniref:hypothetical protein n=1 Tax=Tessaracoccus coleopterorum TaxID=2714950 RepID=UPI0018D3D1C6|nr:hypothetical protein [Tessaracoccus coleopterorum]NHB84313.1 hypothetical protein [Tessaracoccus coleopterorum]
MARQPLANAGVFASGGRQWKTECDTAATGRNGCRAYIRTSYIESRKDAAGKWNYRLAEGWVFNNIVRFKD